MVARAGMAKVGWRVPRWPGARWLEAGWSEVVARATPLPQPEALWPGVSHVAREPQGQEKRPREKSPLL